MSGGMHSWIIDNIINNWNYDYDSIVALTEPEECKIVLSKLLKESYIDCIPFPPDLNILSEWPKKYSITILQAVLEHVCRPSVCLENLVKLTKKDGLICVHTHPPGTIGYHGYPIDCCRFYSDFFVENQKYIPYEIIKIEQFDQHIFCIAKVL